MWSSLIRIRTQAAIVASKATWKTAGFSEALTCVNLDGWRLRIVNCRSVTRLGQNTTLLRANEILARQNARGRTGCVTGFCRRDTDIVKECRTGGECDGQSRSKQGCT